MSLDDSTALRQQLCEAYRGLELQGLSSGSAGNISVRWGEGMLISPSGATGASVSPDCFVEVMLDGEVRGPGNASSEWAMHAEIYAHRPAARAVVHAHPDACVALSCQRRPIPAFHYMVAAFGGDEIPCAEYASFGTQELAAAAADALEWHTACLLANHGMICYGPSLHIAMANALKLEVLARQYILSLQIGSPVLLTRQEMAVVRERYKTYGR
jgi:L-fuculose-phosphate aldolase